MQMDAGLDTGPVLLREVTEIAAQDTTGGLHDRLSEMGARMICKALDQIADLNPVEQPDEGVTYAAKIDKAEARIDWSRPALEVDRQIRGLSPFPGAWTTLDGARIKFLASGLAEGEGVSGRSLDDALTIACGAGAVRISRAQKAGKGAQDAQEFLRGTPVPKGSRFGEG